MKLSNVRFIFSVTLVFLCICLITAVDSDDSLSAAVEANEQDSLLRQAKINHRKGGRGNFLFDSSWPADHGDSSRSKYSLNAGLPANFDPADLKVVKQSDLKQPQWLYTRGDCIYMMGGGMLNTYIARVDAISLNVLQKFLLPPALYLGGLLMHKNGNVYCVHSNVLYSFKNGDLDEVSIQPLPTRLNKGIVQTNGMLVSQDGLLIIKQWALIIDDLLFYSSAIPLMMPVLCSLLVISIVSVCLVSKRVTTVTLAGGLMAGSFVCLLSILLVIASISGTLPDPIRLFHDSAVFGRGSGGGELKFIDPDTLAVVAEAVLPERCSVARMSLTSLGTLGDNASYPNNTAEDVLVLLGDELTFQYRWRPATKTIHLHQQWTKRYRRFGDGSFQATGASIYDEVAYFTDNTFPVYLKGLSYRMFRMPLGVNQLDKEEVISPVDVTVKDARDYNAKRLEARLFFLSASRSHNGPNSIVPPVYLVNDSKLPGFMFWSVVVSPLVRHIITWDTAGSSVQSRSLDDLSLQWELSAWQADCLTVAADRGHVYLSDYNQGSPLANNWLPLLTPFSKLDGRVNKYFVVADTGSGKVLGNITIDEYSSIRISMIIPGSNNDVILGTSQALVRVFV